jgi:hypothetical protein
VITLSGAHHIFHLLTFNSKQVNTPSRIRAYLGYQFTGCLIVMPLEEMLLVSLIFSFT